MAEDVEEIFGKRPWISRTVELWMQKRMQTIARFYAWCVKQAQAEHEASMKQADTDDTADTTTTDTDDKTNNKSDNKTKE